MVLHLIRGIEVDGDSHKMIPIAVASFERSFLKGAYERRTQFTLGMQNVLEDGLGHPQGMHDNGRRNGGQYINVTQETVNDALWTIRVPR